MQGFLSRRKVKTEFKVAAIKLVLIDRSMQDTSFPSIVSHASAEYFLEPASYDALRRNFSLHSRPKTDSA